MYSSDQILAALQGGKSPEDVAQDFANALNAAIKEKSENDLERISQAANWKKSIKFHINIVQPALSKSDAAEDILRLLGSVSDYIKETGNVELKVYCSD